MIIFLYGPDTFRLKEKLKKLKERFISEVDKSGFNLLELEGGKMSINDFNKAIATQSFLSSKRMVIVGGIFKARKALQAKVLELLKKGNYRDDGEETVIIFWDEKVDKRVALFKYLQGGKFKEEFNILENNKLVNWIRARVRERGGKIGVREANILASKSDGNLWALAGEIDKLTALKRGQEIREEDVEQSLLSKIDDNIFNITDAIASKNVRQALKLVEENLSEGMNGIYLLTMIVRQFRILVQTKGEQEKGQLNYRSIASGLGLHPFVVQKAMPQAGRYSMEKLKNIYGKLLEADRALKLGEDEKMVIEGLILGISEQ